MKSTDLDFYHIPLDVSNAKTPDMWNDSELSRLMNIIGQALDKEEGTLHGEKDS